MNRIAGIACLLAIVEMAFVPRGNTLAPSHFAALQITAKPASAALAYFKVVDESKVAGYDGTLLPARPEEADGDETAQPLAVPLADPRSTAPFRIAAGLREAGFHGISETYRAGVYRPDQAIAVGPAGILQSMNTQIALYDRHGELAKGWPKRASLVFGLPDSVYMVDPRAAYDAWDGHYWLAFLARTSTHPEYYVAVSQTGDPNGKWNVYGYDVAVGSKHGPDFTMFGLDRTTVSLSSRVDKWLSGSNVRLNNGIWVLSKRALENGRQISARGFLYVSIDGTPLDTLQPAIVQPGSGPEPPGELFLSTYGFDFQCNTGKPAPCAQMFAFLIRGNGTALTLEHTVIQTPAYEYTVAASTPACDYCLEAVGPMLTNAPVYWRGNLYYAYGVTVPNGKHPEPGVRWGALTLNFANGHLSDATVAQSGTISMPGNVGAFLPAWTVDGAGNFYVLFDASGPALNPSVFVAARRPADPPGTMTSLREIAQGHEPPEPDFPSSSRPFTSYGDFTAAVTDPRGNVWVASQYGITVRRYGTIVANLGL